MGTIEQRLKALENERDLLWREVRSLRERNHRLIDELIGGPYLVDDGKWAGLGSGKGRVEFNDEAVDRLAVHDGFIVAPLNLTVGSRVADGTGFTAAWTVVGYLQNLNLSLDVVFPSLTNVEMWFVPVAAFSTNPSSCNVRCKYYSGGAWTTLATYGSGNLHTGNETYKIFGPWTVPASNNALSFELYETGGAVVKKTDVCIIYMRPVY